MRKIALFLMVSILVVMQSYASVTPSLDTLFDRIKGSMIGGAVGDALGRPTEFINSVDEIFKQYTQGIRSFADFKPKDFKDGIAPYTDDTAMAVVTARSLFFANNLEKTMSKLACAYACDMDEVYGWVASYRAPGNTCLRACGILKDRIADNKTEQPGWWKVYSESGKGGGCGSVMRAHPFGLAFSHDKAVQWAAEHSYLTHSDAPAVAACAAMASGIACAVNGSNYHEVVEGMIAAAEKYDKETAESIKKARSYAEHNIKKAYGKNERELVELSKPVYQEFLGWDARTAIAATVYTFLMAPDSPKTAIYLGVHTPGDSDSIASMAGALVGARVGYNQLIKEWPELELNKLEGYSDLMNVSRNILNTKRFKYA